MESDFANDIKLAAYFQWEYMGYGNALSNWYCAEDIAGFLDSHRILDIAGIHTILRNGADDLGYIEFVRHIAYRLYIYDNNINADANWFAAERLLRNEEWCEAVTDAARKLNNSGQNFTVNQTRKSF